MTVRGGRQVADSFSGIRDDHFVRYDFAAGLLGGKSVIDAACGIGYGAYHLAEHGCSVEAVDNAVEAIDYALEHWAHPRVRHCLKDACVGLFEAAEAAVSFETIEHLADPKPMLAAFLKAGCQMLIGSVPNQDLVPFDPERFRYHVRHYTPDEIVGLLRDAGWIVTDLKYQSATKGAGAAIDDIEGRTIVFVAEPMGETP